jgi:hypothetical protein
MDSQNATTPDRQLERQGRRLGRSGSWWMVLASAIAVPGLIMLIIGFAAGHVWVWAVGIAILLIASLPAVIGVSLLLSAGVTRWAARRKLFA